LTPLEDPLEMDLGLHRWLQEEREEAYSDWLEWVVLQAGTSARVFKLFRLGDLPCGLPPSQEVDVKREDCIPAGHEDHEGRLDLVIRCGDRAIIVVEAKKGDADGADTSKQAGYMKWLEAQPYPEERRFAILLARSLEDEEYEGFRAKRWDAVCIAMRELAIELNKEGRVATAAMVLAFVGAVEQNLLGFSLPPPREGGAPPRFNPRLVDHLTKFVEEA
jgi:hypothetical protein